MVECSGHPCIRVKMPMRGRSGSTQFSDVELEDSRYAITCPRPCSQ